MIETQNIMFKGNRTIAPRIIAPRIIACRIIAPNCPGTSYPGDNYPGAIVLEPYLKYVIHFPIYLTYQIPDEDIVQKQPLVLFF